MTNLYLQGLLENINFPGNGFISFKISKLYLYSSKCVYQFLISLLVNMYF